MARGKRRADRADHGEPDAERAGRGPFRPVHRGHAGHLWRRPGLAGIELTDGPAPPSEPNVVVVATTTKEGRRCHNDDQRGRRIPGARAGAPARAAGATEPGWQTAS